MCEDALVGGKDEMSELSGGEDVVCPPFEVGEEDVVPGRDNSAFVDAANQFNNNLFAAVIIDHFELTDVVVFLHDAEEFEEDLGDRLEEDLLFAFSLGIDDCFKGVC